MVATDVSWSHCRTRWEDAIGDVVIRYDVKVRNLCVFHP